MLGLHEGSHEGRYIKDYQWLEQQVLSVLSGCCREASGTMVHLTADMQRPDSGLFVLKLY